MGWVRLDCDLGTVCACANVVMTRWHAFRLSTSSCLTSVKATTQCVVTYNFFGIAQNRLVNQQETLACVRKVLRCPFLYFCFLLQMSINFSIFFFARQRLFLIFFLKFLARNWRARARRPKFLSSCIPHVWPLCWSWMKSRGFARVECLHIKTT